MSRFIMRTVVLTAGNIHIFFLYLTQIKFLEPLIGIFNLLCIVIYVEKRIYTGSNVLMDP